MSQHDDDGVSDSEGARIDAWDLANEHRWAGPEYTVTVNGIESDHLYTYTKVSTGETTNVRPPMHPGYEPLPRPGVDDAVVPEFPSWQESDDEEDVDPTCGLLNPEEFGHQNVAEDYRHAITTYGLYDKEGAAALIMHFQAKVTSVEARMYAEDDSVAGNSAWKQELARVNSTRSDPVYLDDKPCQLDDYRRDGSLFSDDYSGWTAKVSGDTPTERYESCSAHALAQAFRAPWPLLALAADLRDDMQQQRDAYVEAVVSRKWSHVATLREELGLAAAERICQEMTSDTAEEASPWYKEQEQLEEASTPDERYIQALRTGVGSIAQARHGLSSRKDKREQVAKKICIAQMGLAEDDSAWVERIEKELQQLAGKKRGAEAVSVMQPHTKKKARLGGGAMAFVVGSKRAVEKDVHQRRPTPTERQAAKGGLVPFRTDAVEVNPIGNGECVMEAVRFAMGTKELTRAALGLPRKGDLDCRQLVHAMKQAHTPFVLQRSAPCRWSALLSKPRGIYIFRVELKSDETHYMSIDLWRRILFVGGSAPLPSVDPLEQFLYYDGRRPQDASVGIGRTFFIEDDEMADPSKFEAWVKATIDVASSGVDNMYSVHLKVKHARRTSYNTPEHFDQ